MLYTRKVKDDVDKLELFEKTIETVQDDALMERLKKDKERSRSKLTTYQQGWTEYYVNNFMLARYANMRITDETLYYAEKRGYANKGMQELFVQSILKLFPTPILRSFGFTIDKNKTDFSRGDYLYGKYFGSFLVTSHVGDGLATFGYWYFPIQFIAFYLVFLVLNCYVLRLTDTLKYAPFAIIKSFSFLGMFRNANGVTGDVSFLVRGFIQGVFTYLIIYHLVRLLLNLVNPKYIKVESI